MSSFGPNQIHDIDKLFLCVVIQDAINAFAHHAGAASFTLLKAEGGQSGGGWSVVCCHVDATAEKEKNKEEEEEEVVPHSSDNNAVAAAEGGQEPTEQLQHGVTRCQWPKRSRSLDGLHQSVLSRNSRYGAS